MVAMIIVLFALRKSINESGNQFAKKFKKDNIAAPAQPVSPLPPDSPAPESMSPGPSASIAPSEEPRIIIFPPGEEIPKNLGQPAAD